MPRRRVAERREVLPDPVYNSPLVTKFINGVMWGGKKIVAESIFYDAMKPDRRKDRRRAAEGFQARDRQREADGRSEVATRRRFDLSGADRSSPGPTRCAGDSLDRLLRARPRREDDDRPSGGEILDAANNRGNAVKKKEDTHRMADANKAFAHYKW